MTMRTYEYPVRFTPAEEGGWVLTCRDVPEAISQAEAHEDREEVAAGCLQAAIESRMQDGEDLPRASRVRAGELKVALPIDTAAKAALFEAMREAQISKSDLARRLGVDEKEVRRMLDPGHPSKIPRIAQALKVLGKRVQLGFR
jgi:antitoxin HicB